MTEKKSPTLKQLRCLVALAQTSHFRRAAEICEISQPSLSVQIQNLEEVLGLTLVERNPAGISFSPIGRETADRAQQVLDHVQGIQDLAVEAQSGLAGTIKLGTSPTLGPYLLPFVVAALHRDFKDLQIYVREQPARDLEYNLARGQHDLVLTQMPVTSAELTSITLFREPLYLAMAGDHPLATKKAVHVKDLDGLDVLSLTANFHLHDQVRDLCHNFGANLLQSYEGTSLDALRQMAGMGMGVAFLPALYVASEIKARSEVVAKPFVGRAVTRTIGLVWRKSAGRVSGYRDIGAIISDVTKKKFSDIVIL